MGLFSFSRKNLRLNSELRIEKKLSPEAVMYYAHGATWEDRSPSVFSTDRELAAFLLQLEDDGHAEIRQEAIAIPWSNVYRIMDSPDYRESFSLLGLPPVEPWRPVLASSGALTDKDFSIYLTNWIAPDGATPKSDAIVEGGILKVAGRSILLPHAAWETAVAVLRFSSERKCRLSDSDSNKRAWATIRIKALAAKAELSDFLAKTIVLTPERLNIHLRKTDFEGGRVVEVIPGFEGEPKRWLEMFDWHRDVLERYEIPDGEGMFHVLVSPEVRTVLLEIKRMRGRRVAGDRAQAFLRNPFATLGPEAAKVIDAEQFEQARTNAGISFSRFTAHVLRDDRGYPFETGLLIEECLVDGISRELLKFQGPDELRIFIEKLESKIKSGSPCCHWQGYDLEVLGDTPDQLETLKAALVAIQKSQGYNVSEILDLSNYSARIEGFGVEKPYYSPFIARKNEEAGWFPENVDFGIFFTPENGGETVAVVLNEKNLEEFREAIGKAEERGQDSFDFPGCPKPIPVACAKSIVDQLLTTKKEIEAGSFDPEKAKAEKQACARKGLVVKPNVDRLDYEEQREQLKPLSGEASPPQSLVRGKSLKTHQKQGLTWLLSLWSQSPRVCRGGVLADDMGLGKTLQLLSFMACILEQEPRVDPFLVVAPVSLLENWAEEIDRFFKPGTFRVLTLYGEALSQKRLPKKAIDAELTEQGITRLLRRDWLGDANLVLTTYETLRDLEFSLAMQKWSVMVCDEAQKIKNPNAMITRAAKKQNARFKIACTGTPVENSLVDLWCVFDFIQPGLLGSLKDFGHQYRKPIEAKTEEERIKVEELRELIAPQMLRRTKAAVAKDLPKKIEDLECRSLPLSNKQRELYAHAIGSFRRCLSGTSIPSHLRLLQYLRMLCSVPSPLGMVATDSTSVAEIERDSPKVAWLVKALAVIKKRGEKAIVFCEFRDLQRMIQRVIFERLGFEADIINGDTAASTTAANSRQKRIRRFQERSGFGVIILSPLAVGFGLNIQAANHVIHFTRTWNPAKEDQATARAYRIGQTRDVYVYYPVVVAKDFLTFDAKLDQLLEWKRELSEDILNGADNIKPSDFSDLKGPDGCDAFEDKLITAEDLGRLAADAFETFCAILWSKMGYETLPTPKWGDGGVDVLAFSGKRGLLIQCKTSAAEEKELGWEAVKDVVGGAAGYKAKYPSVNFSLVAVTNRRFNSTAREQAKINQVELIDFDGLAEKLAKYPVTRLEFEDGLGLARFS
ncbi:MAG: SNF2-related protein [Casimicrobiaceae bacterium]